MFVFHFGMFTNRTIRWIIDDVMSGSYDWLIDVTWYLKFQNQNTKNCINDQIKEDQIMKEKTKNDFIRSKTFEINNLHKKLVQLTNSFEQIFIVQY